jgi:protein-glutamine gamma-glutamyltransferase
MIEIAGKAFDQGTISSPYPPDSIERRTLEQLSKSQEVYRYDTVEQLKFEMKLRGSIVNAAKELNDSNLAFKVFRKSKANQDFWRRTSEGGFQLQSGMKPSDAINDIYKNSSQYGTECSTAMVIVYYKALLDVLPEPLFNKLFPDIYLMNWTHLDPDLGIVTVDKPAERLPGDGLYFKNPDVDPAHPEWQGENVFDLGGGRYYGHGIGIATADKIIHALNNAREEGADTSAYLMDTAERPNFKALERQYAQYTAGGAAASPAASVYEYTFNESAG